ncbi:hypothetical protein V5O48_019311 [Marasmius crinis-equi]|uniref:Uncharacterized protein n=1 Tax=Marasmius crinis-equi TaxID=585013 RepID=A0ABR3EIR8_9AGAR
MEPERAKLGGLITFERELLTVTNESTFSTVFGKGIQEGEFSSEINVAEFYAFVAPSSHERDLAIEELSMKRDESAMNHLTHILRGYEKKPDTPFIGFLQKHAPYLVSQPTKEFPIVLRRSSDFAMPLFKAVFKIGYATLQINRTKGKDFHGIDLKKNKVIELRLSDSPPVKLELASEILGMGKIKIKASLPLV